MKTKSFYTVKEILLMGIMSALGMMAKPIFSPVFNAITDFIRIPGGSVTAGVSMMFIVFTAAYIHKKGAGALMGLCQALVSLSTGIGAAAGLPVVDIHDLKEMAEKLNGVPKKPQLGDRVVANVLYRDGSLLDTIREVPAR